MMRAGYATFQTLWLGRGNRLNASSGNRVIARRDPPSPRFTAILASLAVALGACLPTHAITPSNESEAPEADVGSTPFEEKGFVSDQQQPAAIEWETYVDPEYGFSINYPSDWYHYRSSEGQSLTEELFVIFSSALGNTSTQDYTPDEEARLVVSVVRNPGWATAEEWLTDSPLLSLDTAPVSVAGLEGVKILVANEHQLEYRWISFVFLVGEDRGYGLVGSVSPTPNSELWKGAIQAMQDSLVLED